MSHTSEKKYSRQYEWKAYLNSCASIKNDLLHELQVRAGNTCLQEESKKGLLPLKLGLLHAFLNQCII